MEIMNLRPLVVVQLLGLIGRLNAQPIEVIPLWTDGASGFEVRRNEPEQGKDWWVKNIHNPPVTVFDPLVGKAP